MHKFSKRFLLPAVGLAIVAVLIGLDLYVGSKDVKNRIETTLQHQLGVPLQIGSMHYTLWGGLRANDAKCEFGGKDKTTASSTVSIPSVTASLAWGPLLSGQVIIQKLLFKAPVITWVQAEDGQWNLTPLPSESELAESAQPAQEATKKPGKHKPPQASRKPGHKSLEFQIYAIRVDNATLRFIDRQGRVTVVFEGTNLYLRDPITPEGTISVAKTTLREGLTIENFATPFAFRKKNIALAPIDAHLAQGNIRGSATLSPTGGAPKFTLDLLFDGINLNTLLTQFNQAPTAQRTDGTMEGNLDLYGTVGQKRAIEGQGQLRLKDGKMDQISLLQAIGKVLQIEELKDLELHNAQMDLRAAEGKVYVDSLVMESPNMALSANGTSEWDGKLNLAAHLAVSPKISRQLPAWMNAGFQPIPGGDLREIAFNIKGSVTRPNTDLLGVLMGQKYGTQFLNLWQSLTGKGKKKAGERKKTDTPSTEDEDSSRPLP